MILGSKLFCFLFNDIQPCGTVSDDIIYGTEVKDYLTYIFTKYFIVIRAIYVYIWSIYTISDANINFIYTDLYLQLSNLGPPALGVN
jgi:hypothetical protein